MGRKLVYCTLNMGSKEKRHRSEHFTGAASEHFAASVFLQKGYQVYWPGMQQGAVDFVTYLDGEFRRIQVKTATWSTVGPFKYLQARIRLTKKYQDIKPSDLYDTIVIVAPDRRMWVIPANKVTSSNISVDGTGPSDKKRKTWQKYLMCPQTK
jgi:PD-(D/E)XK nuclease superfamily protein